MKTTEYDFTINNERELFFFINMAFTKNYIIDAEKWGSEFAGMAKATTYCFEGKHKDVSCDLINFKLERNRSFLSENSFSLLDDYETCFFAWSYIKHLRENCFTNNQYEMTSWAKTYTKMYVVPNTHSQRFRAIVGYYDCFGFSSKMTLERKGRLFSTLVVKWNEIEVKNKFTRWIDKNDEALCEWLWNALLKEKLVCNDIIIRNTHEAYLAIMGFLSAWGNVPAGPTITFRNTDDRIEGKEQFLTRMHKTWMQKKYREKSKVNELKLSQSTLKKLAFICQETKIKPEECVANYINDVYKKLS
jgi:hypothetical protein